MVSKLRNIGNGRGGGYTRTISVLLSLLHAGSSINMAGRRGDTARFDTQYPECYGLTGRDRETESRLSRRRCRLLVRYFLSRLVHTLPTRTHFPRPKT